MTVSQLLNVSNHTVAQWGRTQLEALPGGCLSVCDFAGSLIVDPAWGTAELCVFAHTVSEAILRGGWKHVHVAGEPGLVVSLVSILQTNGLVCWHTTTERRVAEAVLSDGSVRKESRFQFVRWRMYPDVRQLIPENMEISD
jgi:hypothetical protein